MLESLKVLYVTCDTLERAKEISRILLAEDLIACANIIPGLYSLFKWKGEVTEEAEVAILMKTSAVKAKAAMKRIVELHTYDIPAVEIWSVEDAPKPFKEWVKSETA